MPLEFSERIARIPVYPAADGYGAKAPEVKLASNETPYPPLPAVREAIEREMANLNRYPDPTNSALRQRLSQRYGVPVERIAIGNGSCDVLLAAGEALLEPGAEVLYAWPSFSVYPHLAAASGARAIEVPLDGEDCHDLAAMAAEVTAATRLAILCNPNNPTSTAVPLAAIAEFLTQIPPHVCVILDEAYCEFSLLEDPDASIELLGGHPNLVLLRTFSKVYGLCGLRVGFALCGSSQLPRAVDQVRQPFFCNALAQAAAVEALAHQDAVADRVTRTIAERISVHERLLALGLQPASSQANFCWFGLDRAPGDGSRPDAQELQRAAQIESETMRGLADRGVLVRAGGALGRPGWLRVTYGTAEENARFLDALGEVQAEISAER
jgi:histidinol-phosphate aminotransferase